MEAWITGRELANVIYDLADVVTFAKDFSLRDQIRLSAISAIRNIVERLDAAYALWDKTARQISKFID